jgi:hypothetical protein
MTTRYLTGTYSAGYSLNARYTGLVIESTASVGGTGVLASFSASIQNYGLVTGSKYGIELADGGSVANGSSTHTHALIYGGDGVLVARGTVANFGKIKGEGVYGVGVGVAYGGGVINGSATDRRAFIGGYQGVYASRAVATVANFGTIESSGNPYGAGSGVDLARGGIVTNGSTADTTALIEGGAGVEMGSFGVGAGTVLNYGTIDASGNSAVLLSAGGTVINGSAGDTTALIESYYAIETAVAPATIVNFGTIRHDGHRASPGIYLSNGGTVTNGAVIDTAAYMDGVHTRASIVIANFGTIGGGVGFGGGMVTNGSTSDTLALMQGGVYLDFKSGTIANFGTIGAGAGVRLGVGGSMLENGAVTDTQATIVTEFGAVVADSGAADIVNYGTLLSTSPSANWGAVYISSGGAVTNGSAGDDEALIQGAFGVSIASGQAATITNFGTISGTAGDAVKFSSASDRLVVEAGSVFLGAVAGGGGTLELARGTGLVKQLGGHGTLSGAATMTFSGFGAYEIDAGGKWTLTGKATLGAGQSLSVSGVLVDNGALTNAGTVVALKPGDVRLARAVANAGVLEALGGVMTLDGPVTGTGSAQIGGGRLIADARFNEAVSFVGGGGQLSLAQSQAYSATIAGFSKHGGTSLDLGDIAYVSASEATFSGTKTGGVLTVTDGVHTARLHLVGDFRKVTFTASGDGQGGVIVADSSPRTSSGSSGVTPAASQLFISAMAGLAWGGGPLMAAPESPVASAASLMLASHAAMK